MYLFDIAKDDLLDNTTPASNVGVEKTTSDKASAKPPVARRNSSDGAAAKTEKETEKQHPNGHNNRRRSSTSSSTHLRKSSLMVDVMTGEFLDELLDDDGEDRNDKS